MSVHPARIATLAVAVLFLNAWPSTADAARILIDLGRDDGVNGDATVNPDVNGNYWNNLASPTESVGAGFGISGLVTDANQPTTVSIETVAGPTGGGFGANGYRNGGLSSAANHPDAKDPSAASFDSGSTSFGFRAGGDYAIPTATGDYFFTSNTGGASLLVSGLNPNQTYDFDLFGSRDTNGFRVTRYTATGVNSSSVDLFTSGENIGGDGVYDGNDAVVVNLDGIVPTAAGEIEILVSQGSFNGSPLGGFFYLNTLGIATIPEPTSATLMALVSVCGLASARRRT